MREYMGDSALVFGVGELLIVSPCYTPIFFFFSKGEKCTYNRTSPLNKKKKRNVLIFSRLLNKSILETDYLVIECIIAITFTVSIFLRRR